ncbi:hypothetical protein PBAL39_23732 [Pedobacter sp. BAL39]|nr:hypothetical protein PBAL39_23732 [Pedobacter sp. BAL39]
MIMMKSELWFVRLKTKFTGIRISGTAYYDRRFIFFERKKEDCLMKL